MDRKKPKREPGELSPTEKAIIERWTQGPTRFLTKGNKWFEVDYRWRKRGTDDKWQRATLGKVCKTAEEAGRHVQQKVSQGHGMEVEILKVTEGSSEAPIETGKKVEVVKQKQFQELKEKVETELFENQKELEDEMYSRTTPTVYGLPSKKEDMN